MSEPSERPYIDFPEMKTKSEDAAKEKLSPFQLLMVVLSIYVLGAMFVETVTVLPTAITELFHLLDTAICFVFLADFFTRFARAESKLKFLKWGWIDFVSSIPSLDVFRWGRLIRVIRILRILRALRSTKMLVDLILKNRIKGALTAVMMLSFVLMVFASITILNCETDVNSNIKTGGDALWWSLETITTVGYGDKFPITAEGRAVGSVLMVAGIALFATFTAVVASFFVNSSTNENEAQNEILQELKLLRVKIEALEKSSKVTAPVEREFHKL